jgi:DUF4097 and DUF4098 domain-containing protein YvlB
MKCNRPATAALLMLVVCLSARASEGTFERTLKANGRITLHVLNFAGTIRISVGETNMVRIHGHVTDTHPWGTKLAAQDDRLHQLAGNPPIRQLANTIEVGSVQENLRQFEFDYEIEAPADTTLYVSTGRGDIIDQGVGDTARLITQSGNINALGMSHGFSLESETGDIVADGGGTGEIRVRSGSGNMELRNIFGSLTADSDSGSIRLDGQPKSDWHIKSASGNVEYWANRCPFLLEASTSSGGIHVDGAMETVHQDQRSLTANLRGGGPAVHIETASGEISVH